MIIDLLAQDFELSIAGTSVHRVKVFERYHNLFELDGRKSNPLSNTSSLFMGLNLHNKIKVPSSLLFLRDYFSSLGALLMCVTSRLYLRYITSRSQWLSRREIRIENI